VRGVGGAAGCTARVAVRVTPAATAARVADTLAATVVVEATNVAVAAPSATVTLAGTVTAAALLESVTRTPPAGAAEVSVTVPVEDAPPVTVAGFIARPARLPGGGVTVRTAETVAPPPVAEMVGVACVAGTSVATGKLAAVVPAGTVTVAGTVAAETMLLASVTAKPAAGAATLRVTVPVEGEPPWTAAGDRPRDATAIRRTVSVALRVTPR